MKSVKVLSLATLLFSFAGPAFAEIGSYSCKLQEEGDTHLILSGAPKNPQKVFKTSSEDGDGKTSEEKCEEEIEKIKEKDRKRH